MREAGRTQVWRRQRSYGRPDTGKVDTLTCGRMPHRKDDLAQVRPNPQRSYDRPDTSKVDTLTCGHMPHRKDGRPNPRDGVRGIHPSSRAPTPSRDDRGRTSTQGPEPAVLTQRIRWQAESTGQTPDLALTFWR
ncbi:hypothetical protein BHM03_00046219 [Ensete ventricosum]|nr:hypothetical protein BHM03_00046219 [Ensete ventricosum]